MQVWPQLGLLHASIAKLAHLLEQPSQALAAAHAAAAILAATHGAQGSVAAEMSRIAFEAEQELAQGQHGRQLGDNAATDSE
jgi:hypothetical protein